MRTVHPVLLLNFWGTSWSVIMYFGPNGYIELCPCFWNPTLRCWLTNRHWSQLVSQRSVGALAGNQLFPNVSLERDGKALIDLVDGLSLGSVVFVSVTDGDLVDHDARLGGGAAERLPCHGDQAQAIAATLFVVVWVLFGDDGLGSDQTLSRRTIDEGGLQRVCNHKVQASVLANAEHWEQDISGTILAADN